MRWRTTLLTALAFTLVISLADGDAGVRQRHVRADRRERPAGQCDRALRRCDRRSCSATWASATRATSRVSRACCATSGASRCAAAKSTWSSISRCRPSQGQQPQAALPAGPRHRRPAWRARVHGLELYDGGSWFSEAGVRNAARRARRPRRPGRPSRARRRGGRPDCGQDRRPRSGSTWATSSTSATAQWVVVGVMKSSGSTFDSEVWAKRSLVGPMFGKETYTSLVLRTPTPHDRQAGRRRPDRELQEGRAAGRRPRRSTFPSSRKRTGSSPSRSSSSPS